ncbi:MAG: hypothetical protein AW06_000053 [Candidatus Accumulibacter cognatus]|uniref:Uncharacterized protein n=1 Tax=Candidatus Accumulibacter cognatus TaxID=2954383 RepID=A0A080MDT0_9PROT|nr:MAG: hypothetical protein AW06_000053 [Candidatus Accumulibacter cognatus]
MPVDEVEEVMYPPLRIPISLLATTSTRPALPVVPNAALLMLAPWPSMLRLPLLTFTEPASPDDVVEEVMIPPLRIAIWSRARTSTLPAMPVVPKAPLAMPASSIVRLPVLTFTEPASPDEAVEEVMSP